VPGEPLAITVHDISMGGMGLTVADRRPRPRDLYRLDLRTFEGAISQDIQVRSARPSDQPHSQILGCAFVTPSPHTISVIRHILQRQHDPHPAAQADIRHAPRATLQPETQQHNGHLRSAWPA
jgi:hypothetical protein